MFMFVCDVPDVLKVMKIIKTVILIIKIVVPIILIITAMISFMKEITNNKASLNDSLQVFVKKAIASVVIFLVPTFISLISNAVLSNNNYIKCFDNANNDKIQELYVAKVKVLLKDAKESYDRTAYNQAMKYYNELIEFQDSVGIKTESIDNPEIGSEELQKEIEGYKKELDAIIEVIEEKEKEEIELKRQEEEKKHQQEHPIVTPNAAPTDVPGYDYITAKGPASRSTAAFLEVARSTWLSIVNGGVAFHYGNGTPIPLRSGQNYIDCSGFVSLVSHNYGVNLNGTSQITTAGMMDAHYNQLFGWQEIPVGATQDITNIVQPGDIVVRYGYHYNYTKGKYLTEGHTNIVASVTNGNILVYDAGSDDSLTYGKYPNGFPTLGTNFYKAIDGRAGKIIRVKRASDE